MVIRTVTLATSAILALACASSSAGPGPPPPTRSVIRTSGFQTAEFLDEKDLASATLPASPAEVWGVLPTVYEELEIPVTQRDPAQMILGNPGYDVRTIQGKRMASYLDCGTSPSGILANLYDVTLALATRVSPAPAGGSVMTTILEGWAEPRVTRGNPVHCRSKGTLEERIAAVVAERLQGR